VRIAFAPCRMPIRLRFTALLQRAAPWLFAALLLHHVVHYAWISEDAFINFRVIVNLLDHQGPTWNPGERVQVYTSPLWLALSTAVTALHGDPIEATVWLSFGVFAGALLMLWQASGQRSLLWLLGAVAWCSSRSVRDYICAGQETPLVMAAIAAAVTLPAWRPGWGVRALSTLLALCILVRHDLVLLLAPLILHTAWQSRQATSPSASLAARLVVLARDMLIGAWPLLAWSTWSWLYYGSPVPNTALAKIVQGWDGPSQAWRYHGFMQHFDPQLLATMIASLAITWACKSRLLWPAASGLALFTLYMVHIGADYMAGRFMIAPLTLCVFVAMLSLHEWLTVTRVASMLNGPLSPALHRAHAAGIVAALLAFGASTCYPDKALWRFVEQTELMHDVIDARGSLWGTSDLQTLSTQGVPKSALFRANGESIGQALRDAKGEEPAVFVSCAIGMTGYFAPRHARIVDPLALADRFLAGLPVVSTNEVRVGHFLRPVPRQYLMSLLSGQAEFTDPQLAAYFVDVQRVLHAPLFDPDRLGAIWRLSTGRYRERLARWQPDDGGGDVPLKGITESTANKSSSCVPRVKRARLEGGHLFLDTLARPAS
jgi:arabinofuranosyltransferase